MFRLQWQTEGAISEQIRHTASWHSSRDGGAHRLAALASGSSGWFWSQRFKKREQEMVLLNSNNHPSLRNPGYYGLLSKIYIENKRWNHLMTTHSDWVSPCQKQVWFQAPLALWVFNLWISSRIPDPTSARAVSTFPWKWAVLKDSFITAVGLYLESKARGTWKTRMGYFMCIVSSSITQGSLPLGQSCDNPGPSQSFTG